MDITWYVEDGYLSKSRPHHINIDEDDIADCETQSQFEELINDAIEQDFEMNVSFYFTMPEFKKVVREDD